MTVTIESLGPAGVDPRAQQQMVPMRDGVRLATDVYVPGGAGPVPAVLVRLPYDKNGRYCWMPFISPHFTDAGYAFVPQDVRGKFRSEGETNAFVARDRGRLRHDRLDHAAAVVRTGTSACGATSYYGFTQWAAVASQHPALKAIVPRVTIADDRLAGGASTPLYGAHYLAEYWSDNATAPMAARLDTPAAGRGVRPGLRGDRIALDRLRPARCAEARRAPGVDLPRRPSVRPAAHPDPARRRLVRQHHASAHARLRAADAQTRDRAVPVPARRLDRPRELPVRGCADPRVADHDKHDDCAAADAAALHRAGARLLRRVPGGTRRPRAIPRVRWHLGNDGWQESPTWPPPGAHEQLLHLDRRRRAAKRSPRSRRDPVGA